MAESQECPGNVRGTQRRGARDMDVSLLFVDTDRRKKAKASGTTCRIADVEITYDMFIVFQ